MTTGNTVMPKACRVSKFSPVMLPIMAPAAAALNPAAAQARANTRGMEIPMDMDASWSSETARMEIPRVDFLKNQEKPPMRMAVVITPTNWVQLMETPPSWMGVVGEIRERRSCRCQTASGRSGRPGWTSTRWSP